MNRKPNDRVAVLAGSLSGIAASSLILFQDMGPSRHFLLTGIAIACGAMLIFVCAEYMRSKRSANHPGPQ
jgi:nucleoside permease NupC